LNIFLFVQFINNNIYANTEMSSSKKHRNYYDSQVVSAYLISCKNTVNGIKILMESVERYDPIQKENVTKFGIIGGPSDAFDGKKMHPWLGLQNTCANKKIHFPDDLSYPAAPGSTNILRLDFNESNDKKTRFYVGFTKDNTKEHLNLRWLFVSDIIKAINGSGKSTFEVRNSSHHICMCIFKIMGWLQTPISFTFMPTYNSVNKIVFEVVGKMPQMNSAFLMLCKIINDEVYILTTEEKRVKKTKLGFPGGMVDKNAKGQLESTFETVSREFREETGKRIPTDIHWPGSRNFLCFAIRHSNNFTTGIFVGFTNCEIPIHDFEPNNEIAAINWTSVRDIIDAINGESPFNIEVRNSAKASTKYIFESLGWAALSN